MVSVKQFSILSVFLVAFAESALGAPVASNNLALRSDDGDLALQLAIRDLLEEVDLDDRDLEYQLEELMARDPPVPQPKRKNAVVVPPKKPSGGGSQGQSITGRPVTKEPRPIKPVSKFRRGPPAPQPRPQPPKRKNAVVVPPTKPSGGGSITGRPVTKEPRPIKPVSKFRRGPPATQPRPQPPKRKNAVVVPPPKPSGGGSKSITGRPVTKEPRPIKPASKF
ncbi:unnamed protein product [Clonostachys rhizophaga]|uniref:Uncharacterized protein n=1 Tax=Clonostachys rhizophaga TaxID=160324 RepID=A0A9N9YME0_9HYPO|nr:unnamed protein product [Clonostachys rhizophaga]